MMKRDAYNLEQQGCEKVVQQCLTPMWSAEKCCSVQSVMAKSQQRGHKNWHQVKTQYYCLGRALQFLAPDAVKRRRKESWLLNACFRVKFGKPNSDWLVAK